MKLTALICAMLSAGSGGWASYVWYLASKVNFVPYEEINGKIREVIQRDLNSWFGAVKLTLKKSGDLNKRAAIWTAISVALSGISALIGALAAQN